MWKQIARFQRIDWKPVDVIIIPIFCWILLRSIVWANVSLTLRTLNAAVHHRHLRIDVKMVYRYE